MSQFIRKCELKLGNNSNGVLLNNLRIVFTIKKSDAQSPNEAEIKVYNLNDETIHKAKSEYTTVELSAGYENQYGVIFVGTIRQIKIGRENGTDNYLHIFCSDGDEFYNTAVVNASIASGSNADDHINTALGDMTKGDISTIESPKLARGKVLYGMAKDILRQVVDSSDHTWSIQDGKVQVIPRGGVSNAPTVILNSKTGLVGTPTQENEGIKAQCLINPMLKVGGTVHINEEDITAKTIAKINNKKKDSNEDKPASFSADGFYKLIKVEYNGDTFGTDWYCDLICLDLDATMPQDKKVKDK